MKVFIILNNDKCRTKSVLISRSRIFMSKKLKVLFRTAGGKAKNEELGFGHIFRCINLSNVMNNCNKHFLVEDYGSVNKVLQSRGYNNIVNVPPGINLDYDLKKTLYCIRREKIDILIVDKFNLNHNYVQQLRNYVKTVVISYLHKFEFNADLVVNGFIGYENKVLTNRFGTKCLLGPKYQILDKKYSKIIPVRKKQYSILATFGGFDKNNITSILYKQLIHHLNNISAKIILGPATKKTPLIKSIESSSNRIIIVKETNDMKKDILLSEFGICAGGITAYEFAIMQVPFAIICQYKHQLLAAREWERKGAAFNFGLPGKRTKKMICDLLKNFEEKKTLLKNKKIFIDGLGSQRVAQEIFKL